MIEIEAPADAAWKGYSLTERDRRWNAVRAAAAREGLDCILVMKGNRLDARYLTQIMETGFVLPTDGRPPVVFNDRGQKNAWVPEARSIRGGDRPRWAPVVADVLTQLGMEAGRIGVPGMGPGAVTHIRAADGVLNYGSFAELTRLLPNATFVDATDVVGFVRYVKSDEEIACLRRASAIAEAGIEEMAAEAAEGVDEAVLYARVTARLMELGSEHYCRAKTDWSSGGFALVTGLLGEPRRRFTDPPIGRRLQAGTLITNEVNTSWGGIFAQEVQPILVGPIPEAWAVAVDVQREAFEAGLEKMAPGLTYLELVDHIRNTVRAPSGYRVIVIMHGQGTGEDGPLITERSENEKLSGLRMEAGNTWVWKPIVVSDDGKVQYDFGGTVALTERGAERLFTRPVEFISVS